MTKNKVANEWANGSHLRNLIDYLKGEGWKELTSTVGSTGYLDVFDDDEPNGFGFDAYQRAFVQVNVLVDGKAGVVRIFERYSEEETILAACGNTTPADGVFASALKITEFVPFVSLLTEGGKYIQPEEYFERSEVTLPQ